LEGVRRGARRNSGRASSIERHIPLEGTATTLQTVEYQTGGEHVSGDRLMQPNSCAGEMEAQWDDCGSKTVREPRRPGELPLCVKRYQSRMDDHRLYELSVILMRGRHDIPRAVDFHARKRGTGSSAQSRM